MTNRQISTETVRAGMFSAGTREVSYYVLSDAEQAWLRAYAVARGTPVETESPVRCAVPSEADDTPIVYGTAGAGYQMLCTLPQLDAWMAAGTTPQQATALDADDIAALDETW